MIIATGLYILCKEPPKPETVKYQPTELELAIGRGVDYPANLTDGVDIVKWYMNYTYFTMCMAVKPGPGSDEVRYILCRMDSHHDRIITPVNVCDITHEGKSIPERYFGFVSNECTFRFNYELFRVANGIEITINRHGEYERNPTKSAILINKDENKVYVIDEFAYDYLLFTFYNVNQTVSSDAEAVKAFERYLSIFPDGEPIKWMGEYGPPGKISNGVNVTKKDSYWVLNYKNTFVRREGDLLIINYTAQINEYGGVNIINKKEEVFENVIPKIRS